MPRYKLIIEYDGTPYQGWQRQKSGASIEQSIETAITAFCGETLRIGGAGRTDAGVHATHQVAHCTLAREWPPGRVRDALNAHLRQAGERIAILSAETVPAAFDARRSARMRHYLYRIINRRAPLTLELGRAWSIAKPVSLAPMRAAAALLIGKHDFTTFRAAECQAKSPVKTLTSLTVEEREGIIEIRASARSFLHHQVRSIAGSLVETGTGKWAPADMRLALEARDRARCGPMAPPCGLYLAGVDYPDFS